MRFGCNLLKYSVCFAREGMHRWAPVPAWPSRPAWPPGPLLFSLVPRRAPYKTAATSLVAPKTMFPRLWTERSEGHDRPPGNLRISHQGHNEAQSTKKNPKGPPNEAQTVWGPRVGIILSYRFCCCEWVTLREKKRPPTQKSNNER